MNYCQVPGCARRAKGYARFCNSHRARNRRHGDPMQPTITTARLRPYVREVERFIERADGDRLWASLLQLWEGTTANARRIVADYRAGRPGHRFEVKAAADLLSVASEVDVRRIVATVGAMVLLQEQDARAFKSDAAFWVQTARRFRGLGTCHVAQYIGRDARTHRVYRDANPAAATILGQRLAEGVGLVGIGAHRADLVARRKLTEARATAWALMPTSNEAIA